MSVTVDLVPNLNEGRKGFVVISIQYIARDSGESAHTVERLGETKYTCCGNI